MKKILTFGFVLICVFAAMASDATTTKSVKLRDATINYKVSGQGEVALVFVHGWSCDSSYWREQIQQFSKNYKVVNIDLAGHGDSSATRTHFTVDAFANDVAAVISNEKLENVILVGHSMGGTIIVEAALLAPKKVIGLIAVDTLFDVTSTVKPELITKIMAPFIENFKTSAELFVNNMFVSSSEPKVKEWIIEDMSSAPQHVATSSFENYLKYYSGERSVKSFEVFNLPLVSINANRQPTNEMSNKKVIGNYKVMYTDDTGHFPMMEKPNNFNKLLTEAIGLITQ